jgi:hypothetical protein
VDSDTGLPNKSEENGDFYYDDDDSPMGFFMFCLGVMFLLFGAAAVVLAINYN